MQESDNAPKLHTMIPDTALNDGFLRQPIGTHISKTLMVRELGLLLEASDGSADHAGLRALVLDENVLLKVTDSNRRGTFRRLAELYALRQSLPIYRALRHLWSQEPEELPLLALSCALARDALLRCTLPWVVSLAEGELAAGRAVQDVVAVAYPGRYGSAALTSVGEHLVSTWRQSGHLVQQGNHKVRSRANPGPAATAYALYLGSVCGVRGQPLFDTIWAQALDAPAGRLHDLAFAASQRGWIDYRHAGSVVDIGFTQLASLGKGSSGDG